MGLATDGLAIVGFFTGKIKCSIKYSSVMAVALTESLITISYTSYS